MKSRQSVATYKVPEQKQDSVQTGGSMRLAEEIRPILLKPLAPLNL